MEGIENELKKFESFLGMMEIDLPNWTGWINRLLNCLNSQKSRLE